ncbi:hypothetical protein QTO34_000678 [Cnephaeus nilssonii]|uniref:Retroviral envelope protein GP41-like domain-containing protein n=1 Tax=Cnephaeus nilssonii TaxID=3371016 RepID=A0AA40IC12_CNENI|nr:hypothetical protein QTO34_000678 [Eptesicus nilssonii]
MALVSCQVSMAEAETYWTYVPDPPMANPATWTGDSVPVFTNNTNMVGGSSDKHITPSSQGDYTYNGFSGEELPICLSKQGTSGCLQLGQENNMSYGGTNIANIEGPWDMGKYIQTVTKLGFPKATRWLSDKHPLLPSCPNSTTTELGAFPQWQIVPILYQFDTKYPYHEPMSPGGFVGNTKGACTLSPCYGLRACVQPPYVLVTGSVNITRLILCCPMPLLHNLNEDILILKQPSFIMLPTNITGKWYHDAGLQVLQELHNRLSRQKHALGLIIFGIVTLVTVIASAVTASLALNQSIQNAKFVNELAQNTSTTFHDQEDIDKRLETKLNALEAIVIELGNQLESIKIRQQLQCHAAFTYICVTSAHYNSSLWDCSKIKMHLQGIWHHNNIGIDLVQLHKHVQAIQNSHDEIISPAKLAKELLDVLKDFNPCNLLKNTSSYLIGFLCILLILCCFFSVISKLLRSQV